MDLDHQISVYQPTTHQPLPHRPEEFIQQPVAKIEIARRANRDQWPLNPRQLSFMKGTPWHPLGEFIVGTRRFVPSFMSTF
jgi:hypothetical protein